MKTLLSWIVFKSPGRFIRLWESCLCVFLPRLAGRIREAVINDLMALSETVVHNDIELRFLVPNSLNLYRARSIATKEPDTISWIESFNSDDVLWDIGANVGTFSVYAAKRHPKGQVVAFEPSVLNLELLARNLHINGVSDGVVIVPLPLTDNERIADFNMSYLERGGAHSSFGVDFGQNGRPLNTSFSYRIVGVSIDHLIEMAPLPVPNHIKIDVDGIEHLILAGARQVLRHPALRSILIEIDEEFESQTSSCRTILSEAGFIMARKERGIELESMKDCRAYNQIWVRK